MFMIGDLLQRKNPFPPEEDDLWLVAKIEPHKHTKDIMLITLIDVKSGFPIRYTDSTVEDSFKKVEDT